MIFCDKKTGVKMKNNLGRSRNITVKQLKERQVNVVKIKWII